ncbi:MAG: cysteine hydrolase [Reyranella sp.]|uniref:cysteine hydrolase family protein n=1 Tax=Reyranella sp. TaxID=1929291 RepID=UPI0011FA162F|nr:cysteine hydrolase family protein [Reyranella sp.]TAJ42011.1 MAG: cysteine hydrolase [Reyranella sp.]
MTDALIIIDMQQGAFGEGPPKHDAAGLIGRLNKLADAVRARGGAVVFIQHDGPPGDPFHPDQPGWKLVEDLGPHPADTVIRKKSCDAFLETSLEEFLRLRSIDRLIITGWATDYCVDTTVRSALARGYPTVVPSDGHTAANRPHLPAEKIIEHHNAIWTDFIAPRGPAVVCSVADVIHQNAALPDRHPRA